MDKFQILVENIREYSDNLEYEYTCVVCGNKDGFTVMDFPVELETPRGEYFDKRFTLAAVECDNCLNIQLFHRKMTRPGCEPITIEPRWKAMLEKLAKDQQKDEPNP